MSNYIREVRIARASYEAGNITQAQYVEKIHELRNTHGIRGGVLC